MICSKNKITERISITTRYTPEKMLLTNTLIALIPFFLIVVCSIVYFVLPLNKSLKKAQEKPLVYGFILGILSFSMVLNCVADNDKTFSLVNISLFDVLMILILVCQIVCLIFVFKKHKSGLPLKEITVADIDSKASLLYSDETKALLKKIKENNSDNRSYTKRIALLVLPFVSAGFMYFIFGVYELYFSNVNEWKFIFSDILPPSLLFFLGMIPVALLVAAVVKGKNFDRLVLILSSVCLMSYVQYAFMNSNVFISGAALNTPLWITYINLLLWVAVPTVLCVYYNKSGNKAVVKISALASSAIILIQGAALPVLLINGLAEPQSKTHTGYKLDGSNQFEVSSDENVIVFVMDAFYSKYFSDLLAEQPEYYDTFSDFIFFDDVNSEITATTISMPHILTAHRMDLSLPTMEALKQCWNSSEAEFFYSSIHDAGYKAEFYSDSDVYYGGAENMMGKIDNISRYEFTYNTKKTPTFLSLASLAAYRYFPYWLKELVYVSDIRYVNMYTTSDSVYAEQNYSSWKSISDSAMDRGMLYYNDDYYSGLINGLTTTNEKKCIFQHIHGMHEPFVSEVSDSSDYKGALNGCMTIFKEYINQLKQIGVYDNSTIILTADHGMNKKFEASSVFLIKPAGRTAEKLIINSAPGNVQSDTLPTILDCMGLPYEQLEYSMFDLTEDMVRTRCFRQLAFDEEYPKVQKASSFGNSVVNCCYEHTFTVDCSECTDENCTFVSYPIKDYWW